MTIKANGRSVSIIAAGIWICASGPLLAAQDDETASAQGAKIEGPATAGKPVTFKRHARHSSRYWRRHASAHKLGKKAEKPSRNKFVAGTDIASADDGAAAAVLPPDIANANAAMLPNDATAEATDSQLVSADQLNDLDRALTETSPPTPLLTMAAASTPVAISSAATVNSALSSEDNAWSKSSVVGKIFIAFGGLLTLASAARMFMA